MTAVVIIFLALLAALTGGCSIFFLTGAGGLGPASDFLIFALPGLAFAALCLFFIFRLARSDRSPPMPPPDGPPS